MSEEEPAGTAKRATLGKRLLLLGASLGVFLLLAEGALRCATDNPFRGEETDRIVTLALLHAGRDLPLDRSGVDPENPVVRIRTDERSYILPSRRFESPDATVAFLGGSTTECGAVTEEVRFPALVSTLLEEELALRVDVLNAAKSGNTSHDSLNVLLNHVLFDEPDVVVMMHAANDLGILRAFESYETRAGRPASPGLGLKWLLQELSSRSSLIGATRFIATVRGPGVLAAGAGKLRNERPVDPSEFARRLRMFTRVVRAADAIPVLMTQPLARKRTELTPEWTNFASQLQFNQTVRDVAAAEDALLVDLEHRLTTEIEDWSEPGVVFYDAIHVNDAGSHVYARFIADALGPALQARIGAAAPEAGSE